MGVEEVRIRQARRRTPVLAWRGLRATRLPDRVRRRGQSAVFDPIQNHAPLQRPRNQLLPLRPRAHDLLEPWRVKLRDRRRVHHIRERCGRQHELHHEPRRVPHRGRSGSPRHHPRPGRREPQGDDEEAAEVRIPARDRHGSRDQLPRRTPHAVQGPAR